MVHSLLMWWHLSHLQGNGVNSICWWRLWRYPNLQLHTHYAGSEYVECSHWIQQNWINSKEVKRHAKNYKNKILLSVPLMDLCGNGGAAYCYAKKKKVNNLQVVVRQLQKDLAKKREKNTNKSWLTSVGAYIVSFTAHFKARHPR